MLSLELLSFMVLLSLELLLFVVLLSLKALTVVVDIEEVGDQIVTALCCIVDTKKLLPFVALKSYRPLLYC